MISFIEVEVIGKVDDRGAHTILGARRGASIVQLRIRRGSRLRRFRQRRTEGAREGEARGALPLTACTPGPIRRGRLSAAHVAREE